MQKRRMALQPCRVWLREKDPTVSLMEPSNAIRTPATARTRPSSLSEVLLAAMDGLPLAATLFEPAGPARGTMILHPAVATPQRFYNPFASFLAERGVRVLTYDYRGVGRSRPRSLRGYRATMTEWALCDARAAHRFVTERYARSPLAILGHSFGGQLVGLVDEARDVSGALLVASQFGYCGDWPWPQRARYGFMWRAMVPALTATFGYLPGRMGLGEDLPRGVAEEWARWCLAPDYVISGHPDAAARFARFDAPVALYSFTDDPLAPLRAVDALRTRLTSAKLEHRRVDAAVVGQGAIGHHGFFRAKCRAPLWDEALAFLADVFDGRTPRPVRRPASSKASRSSLPGWDLKEEELLADLRH
jgi:predicted alpha/beta hydrolase